MTEQYDRLGESARTRDPIEDATLLGDERLDLDDLFRVLADRRRRYALYHLRRAGGEVRFPALVSTVLEWETGEDPETLPDRRRQRAYLDLYHNHVPTLVDHGLASYDEEEERVCLETDLAEATPYVELASIHDDVPGEGGVEDDGE